MTDPNRGATPSTAATSPASAMNHRTSTVCILIGPPGSGAPSGRGSSGTASNVGGAGAVSNANTVSVVVWAQQTRRSRDSRDDPWKHTLTYFEFLDQSRQWTHLDALLTRLAPVSSIHIGTSDNLAKINSNDSRRNTKPSPKLLKLQKWLDSLQTFLDERTDLAGMTPDLVDDHDVTGNAEAPLQPNIDCQLHLNTPVDRARIESTIQQLLVPNEDVLMAYRGDILLAHSTPLQQGLAMWLNAVALPSGGRSARIGTSKDDSSSDDVDNGIVDDSLIGTFRIQQGVLNSHLVLDRTAAQCIHLLPPPNAGVATVVGGTAQNNSLYGILSQPCLTKMGKAMLQIWLRQPLIQLEQIRQRQDSIQSLLGLGKDQLRDALKSFAGSDLSKLAATLASYATAINANGDEQADDSGDGNADAAQTALSDSKKALSTLYSLYLLASSKVPRLLEAAESILHSTTDPSVGPDGESNNLPPMLKEILEQIGKVHSELERCQGLAEAVLDLDQAPREFLVKSSFHPDLVDVSNELAEVHMAVQDELASTQELWLECSGLASTSSSSQVKLDQQQDDRWQFRLGDSNHIKTLQSKMPKDIQVHRVLKNGVYFSTRTLRQLGSKYQDARAEYDRYSRQVVRDAVGVASTYQSVVERTSDIVATLDVLCALAYVAAYSPHGYCKPTMTDSEDDGTGIVLKGARHPCVELQEDVDFIPNDVSLVFGESNFLLVTGPNMGGKSTYIRSLGAIVAMAQIGAFVPCQSARINICHSILARVGAGDLQERGISTFMAEMLESSAILRTATKRSLIIIDELGRGTSTFDGYGLARAISSYILKKIGCMVVFATHFHELTSMEEEHTEVKNCHVTARRGGQGLTFLYEVQKGPCLESFGIQVAEMANVPAAVIADAKRKAAELECFNTASKRAKTGRHVAEEKGGGTDEQNEDRQFVRKFASIDLPSILRSGKSRQEKLDQLRSVLGLPQ